MVDIWAAVRTGIGHHGGNSFGFGYNGPLPNLNGVLPSWNYHPGAVLAPQSYYAQQQPAQPVPALTAEQMEAYKQAYPNGFTVTNHGVIPTPYATPTVPGTPGAPPMGAAPAPQTGVAAPQADQSAQVQQAVTAIAALGQLEGNPTALHNQAKGIAEHIQQGAVNGQYNLPNGFNAQVNGRTIPIPPGNYTPESLAGTISQNFGESPQRDAALHAAFAGGATAPAHGAGSPGTGHGGPHHAVGHGGAGGGAHGGGSSTLEHVDPAVQAQLQSLGLETQGTRYHAAVVANGNNPQGVPFDGVNGPNTTNAVIVAQKALNALQPGLNLPTDGKITEAFTNALSANTDALKNEANKNILANAFKDTPKAVAAAPAAASTPAAPGAAATPPATAALAPTATLIPPAAPGTLTPSELQSATAGILAPAPPSGAQQALLQYEIHSHAPAPAPAAAAGPIDVPALMTFDDKTQAAIHAACGGVKLNVSTATHLDQAPTQCVAAVQKGTPTVPAR